MKRRHMTEAQRIDAMTDEEYAKYISQPLAYAIKQRAAVKELIASGKITRAADGTLWPGKAN